jgi:hypothetical protein
MPVTREDVDKAISFKGPAVDSRASNGLLAVIALLLLEIRDELARPFTQIQEPIEMIDTLEPPTPEQAALLKEKLRELQADMKTRVPARP